MLSEFSPELIVVAVSGASIQTTGQKLAITRFDENEIEITGKIENVATWTTKK